MSTVSLLEVEAMIGRQLAAACGSGLENDVSQQEIRNNELGSDVSCSCITSQKSQLRGHTVLLLRQWISVCD